METGRPHRLATGTARVKTKRAIAETWQSQANLTLFLGLLLLLAFILPVLGFGHRDIKFYSDAGFTLLLISGVAIAWGHTRLLVFSGLVASGATIFRWVNWFTPSPRLQLWSDSWSLAALLVIAFVLLTEVFREGRVTHVRIQGAIAVYLLFGAAYAHAYHILATLHPGSFNTADKMLDVSDWVYFSFVTLTTVGYGDITPATPAARILSIGEALTGQLYLAVLIARLVAMEVISWQDSRANRDS